MQYFCRRLCDVFNVDVQLHGEIPRQPALWVSNHISWLDVAVLGSGARVFFLAKAEIEKWPLLGNIAKGGGTLFIQRGSGDSVRIRNQITDFLKQNIAVLFFLIAVSLCTCRRSNEEFILFKSHRLHRFTQIS